MATQASEFSIPLEIHAGEGFPRGVDLAPSPDRYVGYYENCHGEQLVYLHERGYVPRLFHGDNGWAPVEALWPELFASGIPSFSPWTTGDLILDQGEVLWLGGCLAASASLSESPEESAAAARPIEHLLAQHLEAATKARRADTDRRLELSSMALERWKDRRAKAPSWGELHYAEGAVLVALGLNRRQRRPHAGMTREDRERIEREAGECVQEVSG